jgi:hypothetical protein
MLNAMVILPDVPFALGLVELDVLDPELELHAARTPTEATASTATPRRASREVDSR